MPVGELRDAFNSITEPNYRCTLVLLDYTRTGGKEWQVLFFRVTSAGGVELEITSDPLPPLTDLTQATKDAAQNLLTKGIPAL